MEHSNISLQQYLRDRLILLGLLLVIIYGVAMNTLYSWGLDDTAEFYLFQDAEMAEKRIINGTPLPSPTSFKKFIYGKENLPTEYAELASENHEEPQISHIAAGDLYSYILHYPVKTPGAKMAGAKTPENKTLYIIHSFDSTSDVDIPGLSVIESVVILSSIALLFILISAASIYRAISRPVNALYHWAISLGNSPLQPLRFKELQAVGDTLEESVKNIIEISERERSFVRCLSHELRTPMAVVSAALDILDNKEMDKNTRNKTKKIREANLEMIDISDTLLKIWLTKERIFEKETLNIYSFTKELIDDNLYVKCSAETRVENEIPVNIEILIEKQPLSIILTNIIKNSLQYTVSGKISLKADKYSITVNNPICPSQRESKEKSEYGFGLGLFIAETVAKQQSWDLACKQQGEEFSATLVFSKKHLRA